MVSPLDSPLDSPKVLILSIHIDHRQSEYWRKLQPLFVADTAADYEYGVVVNGDDPGLYENVVYHTPTKISHSSGIKVCLDIFRAHRHRFSHFLLLDSDCWPVRADWVDVLTKLMGDSYSYAAPLRVENFDTFPHPSAFFMRVEFLDRVDFSFKRVENLLGVSVSDVGAAMSQRQERQIWYPLIKTNYLSPHPLYASVYGDLFYHHCAGSRGLGFRGNSFSFYDHIIDKADHRKIYLRITSQLLSRPRQFINSLRGVELRAINKAGDQ